LDFLVVNTVAVFNKKFNTNGDLMHK